MVSRTVFSDQYFDDLCKEPTKMSGGLKWVSLYWYSLLYYSIFYFYPFLFILSMLNLQERFILIIGLGMENLTESEVVVEWEGC